MQVTSKNRLQASDSHWFLFLMLPFFAGITALRNYKAPWAKNVIWAFVVFYGLTFAIGKENNDADIIRYTDQLKELYNQEISFDVAVNLFTESGEADVLKTIIVIILSRFTDSSIALTGVYGFIFGFFFSRCLWYLIERFKGKTKGITVFFLVIFFAINPFWNINGFRFNTSVLVFMYGVMPYLYENKKKSLVFCFLSVLVHFSFLLPIAILLVYLAIGNRKNFYFFLFIISVFASNIKVNEFNAIIEKYVPEVFLERSKSYREEERVEEFRENDSSFTVKEETGVASKKNWYAIYYLRFLYWCLQALLIGMFIFGKRVFAGSKWLLNGYCFSLLFFTVGNFMQSLPSGERFLMIAALLTVSVIIFYLQNQQHEKYITKMSLIIMPLMLIFIIVSIRTGFYTISINTILGNPILAIFTNYNLSLNDLIK